jgi:hypothetical protein
MRDGEDRRAWEALCITEPGVNDIKAESDLNRLLGLSGMGATTCL